MSKDALAAIRTQVMWNRLIAVVEEQAQSLLRTAFELSTMRPDGPAQSLPLHRAVLDAVIAIVRPIVECNRTQIDNGRTYLREVIFGDPEEPHHRDALALMFQTEEMIAAVLQRDRNISATDAVTLARTISSAMLLSMAATINIASNVDDIVHDIENQVRVLLRC